jgi:drug/metabolite transporter (DMT)-like permease
LEIQAEPAMLDEPRGRRRGSLAVAAIADYKVGATYAIVAAALIALQEPFSALAARSLQGWDFIGVTQVGLIASIPLMITGAGARRDFLALLTTPAHWPKFVVLLLIGLAGLGLYDVGLSSAHPIIAAAVLNLSPFWAALVSLVISGKRLPGSAAMFFGCLGFAFLGAMMIAWSQIDGDGTRRWSEVLEGALHSNWIVALPMPIFFALSGTLVYVWFRDYDEGAAIAANFVVSAAALIPLAIWFAWRRGETEIPAVSLAAILMLLVAVLSSSAAGRVFYQAALSATENDNGFVTMFFLVIPALSALLSWPLSRWISTLHFAPSWTFFLGLILVTAPLMLFSIAAGRLK